MTIEYQDSEIIILNPYTWTGVPDGFYIKKNASPIFLQAVIGDPYKVLLDRASKSIIEATTPFYLDAYQLIEPSLIGDVLILGSGIQLLDQFLATGSSWKWVEKNSFLASLVPVNGIVYEGDAEDMAFLATLGTFDTILIDFRQTQLNDYSSLLNIGGTIIEMKI